MEMDIAPYIWQLMGCLEVMQVLVEAGASEDATDEDGCTALYLTCDRSHLEVVRFLVETEANKAARRDGTDPLDSAAVGGHLEVEHAFPHQSS